MIDTVSTLTGSEYWTGALLTSIDLVFLVDFYWSTTDRAQNLFLHCFSHIQSSRRMQFRAAVVFFFLVVFVLLSAAALFVDVESMLFEIHCPRHALRVEALTP